MGGHPRGSAGEDRLNAAPCSAGWQGSPGAAAVPRAWPCPAEQVHGTSVDTVGQRREDRSLHPSAHGATAGEALGKAGERLLHLEAEAALLTAPK